jgi:hypothetical protein
MILSTGTQLRLPLAALEDKVGKVTVQSLDAAERRYILRALRRPIR